MQSHNAHLKDYDPEIFDDDDFYHQVRLSSFCLFDVCLFVCMHNRIYATKCVLCRAQHIQKKALAHLKGFQ